MYHKIKEFIERKVNENFNRLVITFSSKDKKKLKLYGSELVVRVKCGSH